MRIGKLANILYIFLQLAVLCDAGFINSVWILVEVQNVPILEED